MDAAVIGGGIVGCHIACLLAKKGHRVFLLEKEKGLGEHASTRNSGVIHAGIYYSPGSLKARLCVRGRALTYEFLKAHHIPHRQCGKIIAALTAPEQSLLEALKKRGEENGIEHLRLIDEHEAIRMEPRIRCRSALLSPETGILDMAAYMKTIEKLLSGLGVNIVKQCEVLSVEDSNTLRTTRGEIRAETLINAAGHQSDILARACGLSGHEIIPSKGDYYQTTEKVVNGLVYPVPDSPDSLGIHLTRTLGEETLIGPSAVQALSKEDYEIRTPREAFVRGALALIPDLNPDKIYPAYSGNRPKLYSQGKLQTDFVILKQDPGRVHLLGIESPGLTAAPAIAEYVAEAIE